MVQDSWDRCLYKIFKSPKHFLTSSERRELAKRVADFEKLTDCELIFHFRKRLPKAESDVEANRALFFKYGLHKTSHRAAVLITFALVDRKVVIFADDGVVMKTSEPVLKELCAVAAQKMGQGQKVESFDAFLDQLEKFLGPAAPSSAGADVNEISNDPIFEE